MKSIYVDFKNGLRGVTIQEIIAEYKFVKENNLEFTIPVLTLAAGEISKIGNFEKFEEIINSSSTSESTIFRTLSKLQNQVHRREKAEEETLVKLAEHCQKVIDGIDGADEDEEDCNNNNFTNNVNYYKEKLEKICLGK